MDNLWPHLGKIAKEYVALELSKIDSQLVKIELREDDWCFSIPADMPTIPDDILHQLLNNISDTLNLMVGPLHSNSIVTQIADDLNN